MTTEVNTLTEAQSLQKRNARWYGNIIFVAVMVFLAISFMVSNPSPDNLGWYTLVPSVFVITFIFWTKEIILAYILGGLMGHYMVNRGDFFMSYWDTVYDTVMSDNYVWLVLVCGLMGSLMVLIERSGGAMAFSRWIAKYIKTRKSALVWTWVLGWLIFTDDYLNCLAIGPSMSHITDDKKISREMLSYIVDTMAAAPCVLIPISTWGAFIAGLLELNNFAPPGEGMKYFIRTIPYSFYAWITIGVALLVILGIIPIFGPMKKAEIRARETGQVAPPGSEKIAMQSDENMEIPENPKAMNLFVPMIVLVVATVYFDIDLFIGSIVTLLFTFFFFIGQRLMGISEFIECCVIGFKNMMFLFVLVALSFSFTATITEMGFADYIVDNTKDIMLPSLMPFILFVVFGITEFMTGTNWDLYMITLPAVIPLSQAIGADPYLCIAAIISAGVWGSHICVASDATICTSAACGCDNYEHFVTQMPLGLIAAILTAIAYLIAGFII